MATSGRWTTFGVGVVIAGFAWLAITTLLSAPSAVSPTALPVTASATLPATVQSLVASPTPLAVATSPPVQSPTAELSQPVERPSPVARAFATEPQSDSFVDPFAPTPLPPEPPRLLIPSLEVDQPILTIPIRDGAWDLTALDLEIGWLSTTGDRPGDALAMAFVGHFTVAGARPGPLADIWDTRPGDEVIYRLGGTDYVYAIEGRQTVGPDDIQALYVNDGDRLLLVTCTNWDFLSWEYSDRLIVQAALVRLEASPD